MELTRQQKVFTFVGTLLALFLGALDQTVVATAGPTIQRELSIPNSLFVWIATSYMLGATVMMPVWGKLSDLFGRRRTVIVGVSWFLAASVLCGLSRGTWQLIAFRALQGMASAALFTTAFAVVADLFSPAERGKYSGIFGAVFGLSSVIGPLVGGFISHHFGWHWVFFINLPIGAVALFFIVTRMPPLQREHAVPPKVDWLGAALLSVAVTPVLLALSLSRTPVGEGAGGPSLSGFESLGLLALGLVATVAFLTVQKRTAQSLIDLSLFKNRVFAFGNAAVFVLGGVFLSPIVFLPLYLRWVMGVSETGLGVAMVPMVGSILLGNIMSGQTVSRIGRYKAVMVGGLIVLVVALTFIGFTLSVDSTKVSLTWKMVMLGLGLGPVVPLYTIAIQNATPPEAIGQATGLATFFRQMGNTVGVTLAGAVYALAFAAGAPHADAQAATASRYQGQRALVARALEGDEQAIEQVQQLPWADAEVKARLAGGGPKAVAARALPGSADLERAQALAVAQARDVLEKKLVQAEQQAKVAPAYAAAVAAVFKVAALLAFVALVLTLLMPSLPLRKRGAAAGPPPTAPPEPA